MGKLSVKKIRELAVPGRYGDGEGLFFHVRQGGSRQWLLRVTVGGKRKDVSIGPYPAVSLDEAREKSRELRKDAKTGGDPLAFRRQTQAIPTFRIAAEAVWQDLRPTWRNTKHADQWINTQREYAFPVIGDLRLNEISPGHIQRVLKPIWLSKEETARRLRQRMRTVFEWAKVAGHTSGDNPVEAVEKGLPKQPRAVRHHSALDWRQLPEFMVRLGEHAQRALSARALMFLILTAARSSEARLAVWSEIDWQNHLWNIPAERMKMKRPHRVPLAAETLSILKPLSDEDSQFIFPGDKAGRPLSDMVFKALFTRMNATKLTAHGFRSTFRDWCGENDAAAREVVEMALAHRVGDKTEQAYARSDLLERRRMLMEKWARFILSGQGSQLDATPEIA